MSPTRIAPVPVEHDPMPPVWAPWPWRTTYIGHAFPEHHYPLEGARHAVSKGISHLGHALHSTWDQTPNIHTPKADIQETENNYYIDIELPGLEDRKQIVLEWISSRTLYFETKLERKPVPEESSQVEGEKKRRVVCTTLKERHLGNAARAFHFPTPVLHANMTAHLANGLLRLTVPKVADAPVKDEHKTVEVQDGRQGSQ